jgi:hypothetical protein
LPLSTDLREQCLPLISIRIEPIIRFHVVHDSIIVAGSNEDSKCPKPTRRS